MSPDKVWHAKPFNKLDVLLVKKTNTIKYISFPKNENIVLKVFLSNILTIFNNNPKIQKKLQIINLKKTYNKIRAKHMSKKWTCMFENCNEDSINSHILQKNGILREISDQNHLIQLSHNFEINNEIDISFQFRKIGINEAYSFPGFCRFHDNHLFKQIESKSFIDFRENKNSLLFSYRTICDELRRKEIIRDIQKEFMGYLTSEQQLDIIFFLKSLNEGIDNLTFFKNEIEINLNKINDRFECHTISFPEIKICISGVLNIEQKNQSKNKTNDIYSIGKVPFVTSIINIFPFNNIQQVVATVHKDYKCDWTLNLLNELQSTRYLKVLSDLLATRTEVWCASPSLINNIPKNKIQRYKEVWAKNLFNFSNEIDLDLNLFEN